MHCSHRFGNSGMCPSPVPSEPAEDVQTKMTQGRWDASVCCPPALPGEIERIAVSEAISGRW